MRLHDRRKFVYKKYVGTVETRRYDRPTNIINQTNQQPTKTVTDSGVLGSPRQALPCVRRRVAHVQKSGLEA